MEVAAQTQKVRVDIDIEAGEEESFLTWMTWCVEVLRGSHPERMAQVGMIKNSDGALAKVDCQKQVGLGYAQKIMKQRMTL